MSTNGEADEHELLLLMQKGDEKAFEALYFTYSKKLYGNILRMVKFPEIAEEILQEIFQRVWERRESLDAAQSFSAYLFTIAKHLVYDFFHRKTRQRHIEDYLIAVSSERYNNIDEDMALKEANAILEQAIHKLPPRRKRIYTLCKIEGKSYEEVSRLLGISPSTISDHIVKATKSIKAHYLTEKIISLLIVLCAF